MKTNLKDKKILISLLSGTLFLLITYCLFSFYVNRSEDVALAEESYTNNPVITVLTHGLGGNPRDWSNDGINFENANGGLTSSEKAIADSYNTGYYRNYNFKYNQISLIETLQKKNSNSYVYIVSANSSNINNPHIDKVMPNLSLPTGYSSEAVSVIDFSKHSIIVYNSGSDFDYDTEDAYNRFKITIDTIVNQYWESNGYIYPKMNLIGHSRGTIINLKYATQYPDRIDSMFALGGLFNGTDILRHLYNSMGSDPIEVKAALIQAAFGYTPDNDNNYHGTGSEILEMMIPFITCPFVLDMSTESYTLSLRSAWNDAVQNKPIKGYAIGSYFDVDFLKAQVGIQDSSIFSAAKKAAINLAIDGIKTACHLGLGGGNLFSSALMSLVADVYGLTNFSTEQQNALFLAINSIISGNLGDPIIPLDGFLELSTQDATGYSNFHRMYRKYGYNTDFSHKAQDGLEIVHNLETQDAQTINYICSNITMGNYNLFDYEIVSGNNVSITRINNDGVNLPSTLTIPSVIGSKTVAGIGQYALANDFYGCSTITSVVIPTTVTEIGFGAFQNCTNLTSVTFAPGSQLTAIYAYAFAGCTNLTSIDLPNSVTTIYEYAFADTGLTSCNLKNVSSLGYGVFSECHALASFSKNSGNGSLAIGSNKAVYGSSSTELLAYACGNAGTSFTIPNSVTIIGEGAFKGANHLTSIGFPSSLSEVRFSAFENCTGLTNIVLPGTVTDIGAFAFCGCYNLTSVRMFSTGNIAIGMGAFTGTDAVSFTVPQARINYYKQTEGLSPYATQVTAITYQISYVTYNGSTIQPTTVYYGVAPAIVNYNTLTRPGYAIAGWYLSSSNGNGTGTAFNASIPYTTKGNTTLYAKWVQMSEGNVSYDANATDATGVMDNSNVAYNGTLTIPACLFERPGYECIGWATAPNGNVVYQSGQTYTFALTSPLTLYAKWATVTYSIVYQANGATGGMGSLRNYYTVENNYTFPAVVRTGFVFYGWVLVGNEDGIVLENTVGYSQDITMRAEWEQTYALGSNSPTTISSTASVLDFSGYNNGETVNKEFTLTRTVDSITLKDIRNLKMLNFNIDNGRGYRIKLIFDNVNFTGKPDWPAIKALSVDLDIYVKTSSTVQGGISHMPIHDITLEEFVYMSSAITCNKMSVYPYPGVNNYPTITFIGRSGVNGNSGSSGSESYNCNGTDGTDGTDGCVGAYGIFCAGIKVYAKAYLIAEGGNGGNGGAGGAGGNGGAVPNVGYGVVGNTGKDGGWGGYGGAGGFGASAAFVFGLLEIKSQGKAMFTPGSGGDGGAGGKGGNGSQGGKGGDGKFGVHAARGGKGGDGGHGGYGGAGGDSNNKGAVYLSLTNNGTLYNNAGAAGQGGAGGQGGSGGAGGAGGKKWPTNNPAESGSPGNNGSPGQPGSNGSLT